jgi:hypothetical protein
VKGYEGRIGTVARWDEAHWIVYVQWLHEEEKPQPMDQSWLDPIDIVQAVGELDDGEA